MKKEMNEIHHHEHNYNFGSFVETFCKWLLLLLVILTLLSIADQGLNKNEGVYSKCASSCSIKHFEGSNVGIDNYDKPYVNEFDRTWCINSCNNMYLKLRRK